MVRLMCASGCVRRRHRVGWRIVLLLLVAVVVLVGLMRMANLAFRVAVAERWIMVMERKVSINKARTFTLLEAVAAGLRRLVERRGLTVIQTQIPDKVGVMSVRLVRVPAVVADRIVRVLVVVVVMVGMAVVAVVVRGMAALVVAAGLVT